MAKKLKRNIIQLVVDHKEDGTPIFETYVTKHHISTAMWYEAIEILEDLEDMEEQNEKAEQPKKASVLMREQADILSDFVIKMYDKQFNKKQLMEGLHAPEMQEELSSQVQFIAAGQQTDETKKFVESMK